MPVTVVMADDDVVELEIYLFPDNTVMQVYGTIHGPPISKPPPRVGKNGHVYNPLTEPSQLQCVQTLTTEC